jgi:hypothetical protein
LFQWNIEVAKEICNDNGLTALVDEFIILDGIKIFGSPWQPEFCDWAFNLPRGPQLKEKWDAIPDDTNVLVTHGPPYMMLDYAPQCGNVGCVDLWDRVLQLKQLKIHSFGHIHYSYGVKEFNGVKYVNASICNEAYRASNDPIVLEL